MLLTFGFVCILPFLFMGFESRKKLLLVFITYRSLTFGLVAKTCKNTNMLKIKKSGRAF